MPKRSLGFAQRSVGGMKSVPCVSSRNARPASTTCFSSSDISSPESSAGKRAQRGEQPFTPMPGSATRLREKASPDQPALSMDRRITESSAGRKSGPRRRAVERSTSRAFCEGYSLPALLPWWRPDSGCHVHLRRVRLPWRRLQPSPDARPDRVSRAPLHDTSSTGQPQPFCDLAA